MEGDNTDVDIEAECKNCNHAISEHRPTCGARFHDLLESVYVVVNDLNTTEQSYPILIWVGQNFIVIIVETLSVF
jgi:hypothetical protein